MTRNQTLQGCLFSFLCFLFSLLGSPSFADTRPIELHAVAVDTATAETITFDTGYSEGYQATASANWVPTFRVLPSISRGTDTEAYPEPLFGKRTVTLVLFCQDARTGEILPNCEVIEADSEAVTQEGNPAGPENGDPAGHVHRSSDVSGQLESRPLGSFDPDPFGEETLSTGDNGFLMLEYTAPDVAGLIEFRWTGDPGPPFQPAEDRLRLAVRVDNLESVPFEDNQPGRLQMAVGESTGHDRNHNFLDASMRALLTNDIWESFRRQAVEERGVDPRLISRFTFTGLQLPWGGIFDIDGDDRDDPPRIDDEWGTPHETHRLGFSADLENERLSSDEEEALADTIREDANLHMPVENESPDIAQPTHWHITITRVFPEGA